MTEYVDGSALSWKGRLEHTDSSTDSSTIIILCSVRAVNSVGQGFEAHTGPIKASTNLMNPSVTFFDAAWESRRQVVETGTPELAAEVVFTTQEDLPAPEAVVLHFIDFDVSHANLHGSVELRIPGAGVIKEDYTQISNNLGVLVLDRWLRG